jgi:hypothetical protein
LAGQVGQKRAFDDVATARIWADARAVLEWSEELEPHAIEQGSAVPTRIADNEPEPVSYFRLEQRRRQLEPGQTISDDIPKLPPGSPWASDPCGLEPLIDRPGG